MMQFIKNFCTLSLMLSIFCSCATPTAWSKQKEIIYQSKTSGNLDVFNIAASTISHEDEEYIKRQDHKYSDLGGQIEFCSSSEYHCLQGGLSVAIPKSGINQKKWSFKDIECRTENVNSNDATARITCSRNKNSITFLYSSSKGILSYKASWNANSEYVLIGEKGLFSAGTLQAEK